MPPADGAPARAAAAAADPRRMPFPRHAADALSRDNLRLELHFISFSHYCARAKWYLGACGVTLDALHPLLPVQHVAHMVALLKRLNAPRCPPTASSRSPAATPALAAFDAKTGAPVFLLQDSELIGRWAALRAQVFYKDGGAAARALYGRNATLSVEEEEVVVEARAGGEGGGAQARRKVVPVAVLTYDDDKATKGGNPAALTPAGLERRLSGVLGVESRRLIYLYLLPRPDHLARMFSRNAPISSSSSSSGSNNNNNSSSITGALGDLWARYVAAPLWAVAASLALPKLLNVNRGAVDRGLLLLEAEFDFLDAMIEERGCLKDGGGGAEGEESDNNERVAAFLFGKGEGDGPSAADISLAALATPLCGDVVGYGARLPPFAEMPAGMQKVVRDKFWGRPTARYARALWRDYGAAAVARASAQTATAAAPRL